MAKNKYDVIGIGNAIVDVLGRCEESDIARLALQKGGMTLIDETRAEQLYSQMGPATECSGGSVANSLAGIAGLGGTCGFIGKVRNDQLGHIFRHDMQSIGVTFDTQEAHEGPATARCLIFVTPDGERTMNTFLGACGSVGPEDIDEALIASGDILYVEGYLWDQPATKEAIIKAYKAAHGKNTRTAFTLSDTFCVERHRDEFKQLIEEHVDILFANEDELLALTEATDFDTAIDSMAGKAEIIAVTRGSKGCVILSGGQRTDCPTEQVAKVVDTTGAGDLFAAGFLYGLSKGWNMADSAALGNRTAGLIIQQIGARSQTPLKPLADKANHAA